MNWSNNSPVRLQIKYSKITGSCYSAAIALVAADHAVLSFMLLSWSNGCTGKESIQETP